MALLVDTGPLYAAADTDDRHHRAVADFLLETRDVLVVPISVLPELCYLLEERLGHNVEARVVASLSQGEGSLRVEGLTREDLSRTAELISSYSDARIGFVDASLVAVAERLKIKRVLTLDRRHFGLIRPRHCAAFELLP